VRAFQSSAGLPPTGRLDIETVKALGSSDADLAYLTPTPRQYETWIPVTKFKHGKWKVKWKKAHRPFGGEDGDEDRQATSEPGWNSYNQY
jgi:peptidoglycan hydrolase-like protein with peptidoglycan-binding domain